VDLLKLDIEGAEVPVLQEVAEGGRLDLIDQMVMEYHHHLQPDEDRLGGLLSTLERNGFGYQIASRPPFPFRRDEACSMFLYAYRKEAISGRNGPAVQRL
jgi:hypothetical protein